MILLENERNEIELYLLVIKTATEFDYMRHAILLYYLQTYQSNCVTYLKSLALSEIDFFY